MNLGQMLFNGKCKVFAPFYYIPMEIGIKYFLQGNFSIKIINIMKKNLLLFSYLLKPISYVDFLQSVNKAVQWYELKQKADNGVDADEADDCIYVKSDYKLLRIALDRILYIEGLKDYIKIHVEDEPKAILSLVSMKAMEEKLPSSRFIRVHRSFIVQKSKIKVVDRGRIVFGKEYIPISDSYKQELQMYLNSHSV